MDQAALAAQISEIYEQILKIEKQRIKKCFEPQHQPAELKRIKDLLAPLLDCTTAVEASAFLHDNQGKLQTTTFCPLFADAVYEEMVEATKGWVFVNYEKIYTGVSQQYSATLIVQDPDGLEHHYVWGNNGANGMRREFERTGTKPDDMAYAVLAVERMRRRRSGEPAL